MSPLFLQAYAELFAEALGNDFDDNLDVRRFGLPKKEPTSLRSSLARHVSRWLRAAGFVKAWEVRHQTQEALSLVAPHLDDLDWLYHRLRDDESRNLLLQLLAFRALGHRRVKLPLNNEATWDKLAKVEELSRGAEAIDLDFLGFRASKIDLSPFGYPIELFTNANGILHQFLLEQYRCATDNYAIEAAAGDIVLDSGGCYGDTALYFSHKVGPCGRVYSFEFLSENVAIFEKNLALNQGLAERIEIIQAPLWSTSGAALFVAGKGPAARVLTSSENAEARRIETLSIDDFVHRESLPRVDFIKMDIEGSEMEALKGASATIRAFRPKLAIAVYHRLPDFWTISQYIDSLDLGYELWLRHFTIHHEETILFAAAPR